MQERIRNFKTTHESANAFEENLRSIANNKIGNAVLKNFDQSVEDLLYSDEISWEYLLELAKNSKADPASLKKNLTAIKEPSPAVNLFIGTMYLGGFGFDKDGERGFEFLWWAANQGYGVAMSFLGDRDLDNSPSSASMFYHMAITANYYPALVNLSVLVASKPDEDYVSCTKDQTCSWFTSKLGKINSEDKKKIILDNIEKYKTAIMPLPTKNHPELDKKVKTNNVAKPVFISINLQRKKQIIEKDTESSEPRDKIREKATKNYEEKVRNKDNAKVLTLT
jgi:hypothetical protein